LTALPSLPEPQSLASVADLAGPTLLREVLEVVGEIEERLHSEQLRYTRCALRMHRWLASSNGTRCSPRSLLLLDRSQDDAKLALGEIARLLRLYERALAEIPASVQLSGDTAPPADPTRGLPESDLARLERLIWSGAAFSEAGDDESDCPICLAGYVDGEELLRLPCGHRFHGDCGQRWFEVAHSCPLCRGDCRVEARAAETRQRLQSSPVAPSSSVEAPAAIRTGRPPVPDRQENNLLTSPARADEWPALSGLARAARVRGPHEARPLHMQRGGSGSSVGSVGRVCTPRRWCAGSARPQFAPAAVPSASAAPLRAPAARHPAQVLPASCLPGSGRRRRHQNPAFVAVAVAALSPMRPSSPASPSPPSPREQAAGSPSPAALGS